MSQDSFEPIVERLKQYIAETGLTNTQFADRAGIPRPTLSQILHGRNKTINDVLLRKLDAAFPDFNLSWLLFGRGDMHNSANSETSELENELSDDDFISPSDNYEPLGIFGLLDNNTNIDESIPRQTNTLPGISDRPQSDPTNQSMQPKPEGRNTVNGRTIRSIIVFYSDNSFETFTKS